MSGQTDASLILLPMLAHVCLAAILYAALTVVRAPSVWGLGLAKDGTNPWRNVEPRISANLSNQFEWPVLFYVACVLGMLIGVANERGFLMLAWLFVAGRIAHSLVQILTENIRLRGIVFTLNFVAVLGMWSYLFGK
ncbi:MAG: MAPEG family protein [Pseudomonadota bacterium]